MTAIQPLESAIYRGRVRHRRFTPKAHVFNYPLFMFWLKTSEIPTLIDRFWQLGSRPFCWARFRRTDYIGDPDQAIDEAVKGKIRELLAEPKSSLDGDVFMLCHLRCLGHYFSPLNLYYLRQAGKFRYLLAEVSNTPWNERHYYLLDVPAPAAHAKAFHVSPFNPMQQTYHWRLKVPSAEHRGCAVHIESMASDTGEKVFDATLALRRRPLNQTELSRVLLSTPAQTISVVTGIYWQALKLFVKRMPLYQHPNREKAIPRKGTL